MKKQKKKEKKKILLLFFDFFKVEVLHSLKKGQCQSQSAPHNVIVGAAQPHAEFKAKEEKGQKSTKN